ncbi:MAG: phage tail protein [Hyphomicrobiales bacterium]|nr:MAG: phage tail protein [Hyphomicrobiales bacterium]
MTFDQIPYDRLEPGTFTEIRPNYRNIGLLPYPVRSNIIGQKLAAGTLVEGVEQEIVNPDDAIALFGVGSIGAEQVRAFRKTNKTTPLYVVALGDADGAVKATGTFTFVGSLALATVLRFKVAGQQVRITVEPTDVVADMATNLAAAIMAETSLVVTAGAALGVVTVTCKHGGEVGNDIDLRVYTKDQPIPDGLTIAVADMADGAGNPDVDDAFDALSSSWYTQFQMPWNDSTNMAKFAAEMRARFTALAKLDAHGFVAKRGTYGELGTFGELTNEPFISAMGLKNSPTSSWVLSAAVCGLATFHLTNDPARQLRSLVVEGVEAPEAVDQFTETEQDLLLRKGIATFDRLPDDKLTISRLITTYKTSNLGIPDRAWMDIMVPATLSRIRYDWSAYVGLLYPRSKLLDDEDQAAFVDRGDDDDGLVGNAVVTPRRMHGSWAARCALYAKKTWVEKIEKTLKESYFVRGDDGKNRLNASQQLIIVGNLMVLAGALEFQA